MVKVKLPFMRTIPSGGVFKEQMIINPKKYTADEKQIETEEGDILHIPLLKMKPPWEYFK